MKKEIEQYMETINEQDTNTFKTKTPLLNQLQNHFQKYEDYLIYFNIHVDSNNYIDDEYETWTESKHTLEISLTALTPSLLAEIEVVLGAKWELQTDRDGIMCMKFELTHRHTSHAMETKV